MLTPLAFPSWAAEIHTWFLPEYEDRGSFLNRSIAICKALPCCFENRKMARVACVCVGGAAGELRMPMGSLRTVAEDL